jgi:hypothetical protein
MVEAAASHEPRDAIEVTRMEACLIGWRRL